MTPTSSTSASASPSEPPPRRGRAWLAAIAVIAAVLAGTIAAALSTPTGRELIARALGAAVEAASGYAVRIDGLGAGLPFRLRMDRLTLADGDGIWLTADAVDVALSPRALLTAGRMVIEHAFVADIALARLPLSETGVNAGSDGGGGFSLPRLPAVLRLALPRIQLAAPVLGEAVTLSADGGITALDVDESQTGEGQRLSFTVARTDAGASDRLTLTADGAGSHWRGELAAEVAAWGAFDLRFTADGERETAVAVDGEARLDDGLTQPVALGPITLSGEVMTGGADRIAVRRLDLAAGKARLTAAGIIDPAAGATDLTIQAKVPPDILAGLSSGALKARAATANAAISGPLTQPSARLSFVLTDVEVETVSAARIEGNGDLTPQTRESGDGLAYAVAAEVRAEGARYGVAGVAEILGDAPSLSLSLIADPATGAIAEAAASLHGARGRFSLSEGSLAAGRWQARIAAALDDLAAVGTLAQMPMRGRLSLDGQVAGAAGDGTAQVEVRAEAGDFVIAEPALQAALGARPTLTAEVRRDGVGDVHLDPAVLTGANAEAEATGRYRPETGTVSARLDLRAPRLAPLLAAIGIGGRGAMTFAAVLDGAAADPDLALTATLERAEIEGIAIASARADARLQRPASAPEGTWRLAAATAFGAFDASSRIAMGAGNRLELRALALRGPGTELLGQLAIPMSGGPVTGAITGRFAAEPAAIAFGDVRLGGRADLAIGLTGDAGRQGATFTLAGRSLAVTSGDGAPVTVQRLDVRVDGILDAGAEDIRFTLNTDDPAGLKGRVTSNGRLVRAGSTWQLGVDTLKGQLQQRRFALAAPLEARAGDGAASLSPFTVTIDGGRLEGEGRWRSDGALDARLTATRLPLSLLRLAVPAAPSLDGVADVRIAAWNAGERVAADLGAEIKGGGGGGKRATPAWQLKASGRLRDGVLDAAADGEGPGGSSVDAKLTVPLALSSRDFRAAASGDDAISGSVRARAELAPLTAALGLDGQAVKGSVAADLAVAGTLKAPKPSGEFSIRQLRYENFTTGTIFDRGSIEGRFDGGDRLALTLSAGDGGKGRIDGDGELRFGGPETLDADITVRAADARLLRRDDVEATATAEVRYRGTAAAGLLEGQITAAPVEVSLVDRLPPSVVVLQVTEVGGDAAARRAGPPAAGAVAWQAKLDLTVDMPRRIFVRGRGLEAEWSGALRVAGTTEEPRVEGRFDLIRGQYDFAGKRFVLTRGIITLTGGDGSDAIIDLAAERRTADITAVITATGPASRPEIRLSADRDLPESEILSQVLFGKSSARLGPVEAVQLGAALQGLASGRGVSDDAFSFVRGLLGLDTLAVGTDEATGAPTVGAGRYIGDRVFIGGTQGTEPGSTAGTVAVEIAPGITVESELQQGQEEATGTIGLRWKWDY